MRFTIAAVSLFASVLPTMKAAQPPIDLSRLLECISEIEGGAATDAGGRPCMNYGPWSDRTDLAYQLSRNETTARPIFLGHLRWLEKQLKNRGISVNAQTLSSCWRWGMEGAKRKNYYTDYGQRCANLFNDREGFKP